jgi:hypothetical protein
MTPFTVRLRREDLRDAAELYQAKLFEICMLSLEIALLFKRWGDVALITGSPMVAVDFHTDSVNAKRADLLRQAILRIEDERERSDVLAFFDSQLERLAGLVRMELPAVPSVEEEEQIYRDMARGLGIDIENPEDPIADVIAIGIRDLNPERALRDCRHLFLTLQGGGLPARIMRLPTAGFKALHCTRHGYGMVALRLDDLYRAFRARYCKQCQDHWPHPENWRWTREWQYEENARWGKRFAAES